jgi:hypothetical protein
VAVFRNASTGNFDASFTQGQIWVNSRPKTWRPPKHSTENPPNSASPNRPNEESTVHSPSPNGIIHGRQEVTSPIFHSQRGRNGDLDETSPHSAFPITFPSPAVSPMSSHAHHEDTLSYSGAENTSNGLNIGFANGSRSARSAAEDDVSSLASNQPTLTASAGIQEACLLRYFIEEVSPWVRDITLTVQCNTY